MARGGVMAVMLAATMLPTTMLPATSLAQSREDPTPADKETARELFREGDDLFRAASYEDALKAFEAADDIMGVPTTGLERARTLMMLGRLLEASEHLQRIMRIAEEPDENEVQKTARAEAADLLEQVRERIPSLRVIVEGHQGADVTMVVDDVEVPVSAQDFPRKVDPGEHHVRVVAAGYRPEETTVAIAEGQERVLRVTLQPTGSDTPLVDPWASSEDGQGRSDEGTGPEAAEIMMWTGYGVAAVGLIAGTVTGAMSLAKTSELQSEDKCGGVQCPPDLIQERDDFLPIAHASTASFVIAGVGAAVGTIGLVLSLRTPRGEQASVSPFVGPGSVGLTGSF